MIESKFLKELVDKPISGEWGDDGGNIKVLRTTNFTNERIIDYSDVVVRDITFKRVEAKKLLSGDLIIEKSGGSPKQPVGRVVYFDNSDLFLCNNFTSVLRPKRDLVFPKYLLYILFANHQYGFTGGFQNKTTGIINLQLARYIDKTKIPLPPLDQQKKIAAILDAADAYRQKTKALIEKYDELTQSLFLDMFGDPITNPKGWEKKGLSKLGNVVTGSTPPSSKEGMFGGNIPFVTPGDLGHDRQVKRTLTREGAENSRLVRKGSLFLCCIGATIGKKGIARTDSSFNQQINAVEWNELINDYWGLYAFTWLKHEVIERAISTTLPIMKKSEFEKVKAPCPPIYLQNQFAERVQAIEAQKAQGEASLAQAEDLFNSFLQRAFKGELN